MRLDGYGLFVNDMATMIRFYRDVLGFFIALDYFLALIIAHFDEKCTVYREFY